MIQNLLSLVVPLKINLLLQVYWLSIFCIGVVFFYALQNTKRGEKLASLPLVAKAALSYVTALLVFLPCVAFGYLFGAPAWFMVAWYATLLITAGALVVRHRRAIKQRLAAWWQVATRQKLISVVTLVLLAAVAGMLLNFLLGGYLDGDGIWHMGKVRHIAESGMNLVDFFYGSIIDTGHAVEIIHILYAIPAVLGVEVANSYASASMFLNIFRWLTFAWLLHTVVWNLKLRVTRQQRRAIYGGVFITVLALANTVFATYPWTISSVIMTVLILSFFHFLMAKDRQSHAAYTWLLLGVAVTLTFSHILAAIVGAALIGLMAAVAWLVASDRRIFFRKHAGGILAMMAVLAFMPAVTILLQKIVGAALALSEYKETAHWHLGPLYAVKPHSVQAWLFPDSLPNALWIIVLSVIGLIFIIRHTPQKLLRVIYLTSFLFIPLVLWNPLVYPLLDIVFPEWAIARFYSVNIMQWLLPGMGLAAVIYTLAQLLRSRLDVVRYVLPLASVALAFFLVDGGRVLTHYAQFDLFELQPQSYQRLLYIDRTFPQEKRTVVLANDIEKAFYLVAATGDNVKVLAVLPTSSPGDGVQRAACQEYLNKHWRPGVMKQLGVRHILTTPDTEIDNNARGAGDMATLINGNFLGNHLYELHLDDVTPETIHQCVFREKSIAPQRIGG